MRHAPPRRKPRTKLARAKAAADALTLDDLRKLDDWLHDRINATAARAEETPPIRPNRVVIDERTTPTGTYRRELVACGKGACKACGGWRPTHGPYWYVYWKDEGRTRSRYVGKEFKSVELG
jgi:hypothetical protein